jgi:LacI family transcriptional regulator
LSAFERISFGGGTIEGCRAAIEQDLRRSTPPTAIFAATFYATLGAVKAINALDLAFPEEISLLGFEHSEWMMAIRPYISAVRQSVDDLAAVSWRTLCNRMAGESAELVRVLLDFRCEFRESTRPPAMAPTLAPAGPP